MKRFKKPPMPFNTWKTWQLELTAIILFPVLLWLSQFSSIGLDFMNILNNGDIEWSAPTIIQAITITAVFIGIGMIALPCFIISAACITVLTNRLVTGEETAKKPKT